MNDFRTIRLPSGLEFVMLKSGYIDVLIENFGDYEYYDIDFLVSLVKSSQKPLTILDVGANNGIFSIAMAKTNPLAHIYAFEPDKDMVKNIMTPNILANDLVDKIDVVSKAVGDCSGTIELHVDMRDVFSSLVKQNIVRGKEAYLVDMIALDEYFADHSSLDILKIDVQGYELHAFRGATRILSDDQAPLIMFEGFDHHARGAGNSTKEIVEFLESMGYTTYLFVGSKKINIGLDAKPGTIIKEYRSNGYPLSNYIAVKNKYAKEVRERCAINL